MNTFIFISFLFIIVISFIGMMCALDEGSIKLSVIFTLLTVLASIVFMTYSTTPRAIDVYRGKTALEYTIVNGHKTDSTVIFKTSCTDCGFDE